MLNSLIPQAVWDEYKELLGINFAADFAQKLITWRRFTPDIDRFSEDDSARTFTEVPLLGLLHSNVVRSWPIDQNTETGTVDRQSFQVFFPKQYLEVNGYLNSNGLFSYQPDNDKFVIDGLVYLPQGDTPTSQMTSDDLYVTVILGREILPTDKSPR